MKKQTFDSQMSIFLYNIFLIICAREHLVLLKSDNESENLDNN